MNETTVEKSAVRTDIPKPRKTFYSQYIKRFLDIILSGLAIIVLSPLLLIIAVLELVFHGRPVLYIDKRPGKDGKIFNMYKFRSMSGACDENGNLLHPSKRITSFGRILRRTSLDELAGLFNVFNGTMSIIGPRPLMTDYLPLYNERHKYRHSVRPGLACWKIGCDDKLTSESWTWNTQFESDIYYVEHISFLLDVRMVLKTIKIIFSKSEMRTNSDRVKFNGENLLETRTRHEIIEAQQKEIEKNLK
ncbi:MAG: sugar transferase [Oscillospiraceae bacterium]|nr:sugar transferase [Oscillospiraceae bacterium]